MVMIERIFQDPNIKEKEKMLSMDSVAKKEA